MGRKSWSLVLIVAGFLGMLAGAVDPLEGSFVILPASGMAALGLYLARSRYRQVLSWAFAMIAFGVGAMIVLSVLGGIGGNSGNSMWWGLFILPYPVGWLLGVVGTVLALIEFFRHPAVQGQAA